MTGWKKLWVIAVAALVAAGCKDVVSPHMKPEGDPARLVASMAAATNQALLARSGVDQQVVLTINNAPEANEPLEQDFLTEVVELFERRNPQIRIQYSPWQYTPESFFERLNNRTLTDIIEVDAAQMVPIIEANAAADLTENVKITPEIQIMNPEVFKITSSDGRTYGVPTELHTLALFYNRRLLEESKITVPAKPEDKEKGKGAAGEPRDYVLDDLHLELPDAPLEVAQYGPSPYYPPGYQSPPPGYGRGQREMERYYNQRPQQRQQQNRQQYEADYYRQQQEHYRRHGRYFNPGERPRQEEDARERRVQSRKSRESGEDNGDASEGSSSASSERRSSSDGTGTGSSRRTSSSDSSSTGTESGTEEVPDDTLTAEAEQAMQDEQTTHSDAVTTVVQTAGLPADLEQFIRLAVRLTDHKKGIYGYGPVLYAREGGREYTQWAVQAGLNMQSITGDQVVLDVDQSGEVAQFLKDLHVRFDVTPPPTKCYFDNLMTMYAEGKLGMMIMPADGGTISELLKRGMPLEDIGIAALPQGLVNRDHLTYGKCLIINSQLDQSQRAAAFKWLMFMASPEVQRMRAQFFFREGEITAAPSVPLYSAAMQAEYYASIRPYRALPLWNDYEAHAARNLHLEPSFYTDRFYEALAEGLRPIIERRDSDPFHAVTLIATGFEKKYIRREKPDNLVDRYVQYLMEKKAN